MLFNLSVYQLYNFSIPFTNIVAIPFLTFDKFKYSTNYHALHHQIIPSNNYRVQSRHSVSVQNLTVQTAQNFSIVLS